MEPRNRYQSGCRRCSLDGRQNRQARYCERPSDPAWSETLACTDAPCAGTGRSLDRPQSLVGSGGPERVEPGPGTKGNADQQSTHRAQSRARVTQALGRVRRAARQRKKEKFTALLHHINVDTLRMGFYALKRKAAPGVDGMTWQDYEADLELRIEDLHGRVHRGAYRPQPSRPAHTDKADGKKRPLAIAALQANHA